MLLPYTLHSGRATVPSTSGSVPQRTRDSKQRTFYAKQASRTGQEGKKREKKQRAPQWPVRRVMPCQPMAGHLPGASHQPGPALGLIQPVTGVKRLPAPRPSNHIFAFSLVLFASLASSHSTTNQSRPALSDEPAAIARSKTAKKRALPALTRAIRFVRKGASETPAGPFTASRLSRSDPLASRAQRPSIERLSRSVKP